MKMSGAVWRTKKSPKATTELEMDYFDGNKPELEGVDRAYANYTSQTEVRQPFEIC